MAADTLYYIAGDRCNWKQTLKDANGNAINLTGATVKIHVNGPGQNGPSLLNAAVTLVDAANGVVQYFSATPLLTQAQVTSVTSCRYEYEATFADSSVQTYPGDDPGIIEVRAGLA